MISRVDSGGRGGCATSDIPLSINTLFKVNYELIPQTQASLNVQPSGLCL